MTAHLIIILSIFLLASQLAYLTVSRETETEGERDNLTTRQLHLGQVTLCL